LTVCRFVQGSVSGAESSSACSTLTEFVPPRTRGRWLSMWRSSWWPDFRSPSLLGFSHPVVRLRPMFIIAGVGSLIVWYMRKNLPESPRWLESQGRSGKPA